MASYMVNPSKKATEFLSKYLEFDPNQLQLGIWSGDLSITDVHLRRDAIGPLLNSHIPPPPKPSSTATNTNNTSSPFDDNHDPSLPLPFKLVTGTVGQMRIKIPWKRLVWGNGDVQLEISDVNIVLAYESRDETRERLARESGNHDALDESSDDDASESDNDGNDTSNPAKSSRAKREAKQKLIREAERAQLQGIPIPQQSNADHQHDHHHHHHHKDKSIPDFVAKTNLLESWLKKFRSGFTWRFLTGLQASIRNVRVVLVQEGIEMGLILHSMDVKADKDFEHVDLRSPDPSTDSFDTPSIDEDHFSTLGAEGEHVDKSVRVSGLGVFVRQASHHAVAAVAGHPIPITSIGFSTSVTADDYIIRPASLTLKTSFFYPNPDGKPKPTPRKRIEDRSNAVPSTDSSTTSSKQRRGKREKRPVRSGDTTATETSTFSGGLETDRPNKLQKTEPTNRRKLFAKADSEHMLLRHHMARARSERFTQADGDVTLNRNNRSKRRSLKSTQEDLRMTTILEAVAQQENGPHLEINLSLEAIKTVCSSKHYALALAFSASVARMRNGRPKISISDVMDNSDHEDAHRSVMVDAPLVGESFSEASSPPPFPRPKRLGSPELLPTPHTSDTSTPFRSSSSTEFMDAGSRASSSLLSPIQPKLPTPLKLPGRPLPRRSPLLRSVTEAPTSMKKRHQMRLVLHLKSEPESHKHRVLKSWWQYAISNVLYEVRGRREAKTHFGGKGRPFDWKKQRAHRRDYVNMYIATRLEKTAHLRPSPLSDQQLLRYEDELAVPQILLYRSIARSLVVRGKRSMPKSILDLHNETRLQRNVSLGLLSNSGGSALVTPARRLTRRMPFPPRSTPGRETSIGSMWTSKSGTSKMTNSSNPVNDGENDLYAVVKKRQQCQDARKRRKEDYSPFADGGMDVWSPGDEDDVAWLSNLSKLKAGLSFTESSAFNSRRGTPHSMDETAKAITSFDEDDDARSDENVHEPTIESSPSKPIDAVTIKSFKTSNSRFTSKNSGKDAKKGEVSHRMRFSFSINIEKIEVLLYEDENFLRALKTSRLEVDSNESSHFSVEHETQMELEPDMHFVGDDMSSEGMSDITLESEEQVFFEENKGRAIPRVAEEEEDDQPILSSTDFLFFGMPSGVLLNVTICNVGYKFRGLSGGPLKGTFSVSHMQVQGDHECELLSIGRPDLDQGSNPIHEVQIPNHKSSWRKENNPRTHTTNNNNNNVQACQVTVVHYEGKKYFTVEVARAVAGIELPAIARLQNFVSKSEEIFPAKLMCTTARDQLRSHMIGREYRSRSGDSLFDSHICACRFHGFDVIFPDRTKGKPEPTGTTQTSLKASIQTIEYFNGTHVDKLASGEELDDLTLFSEPDMIVSPLNARKCRMLDLSELLEIHSSLFSKHGVVNVAGMQLSIERPASQGSTEVHLLREPVDVEVLLTSHATLKSNNVHPRQELVMAASGVRIQVSADRLAVISRIASQGDGIKSQEPATKAVLGDPPRLIELSNQIDLSVDFAILGVELAFSKDFEHVDTLSFDEMEVILQESIADYLSVVACFDFDFPVKEAIHEAYQLCIDRLMGLGLTDKEARRCADRAKLQFLGDIDLVKRSQSDTLHELSSGRLSDDNLGPIEVADLESLESNPEHDDENINPCMDDESQESFDILETTMSNAVEQAIAACLPLLERHALNRHVDKTLFVLDAWHGMHISFTKLFYDKCMSLHVPSLSLSCASGVQLLRAGDVIGKVKHPIIAGKTFGRRASQNTPEEHVRRGIFLCLFEVDSAHDFGTGGEPLSELGTDPDTHSEDRTRRERLTDCSICELELLFCERIASDLLDLMGGFRAAVATDTSGAPAPATKQSDSLVSSTFTFDALQCAVLLTSNELNPFSRMILDDVWFVSGGGGGTAQNTLPSSDRKASFLLEARSIWIFNLSPEGQFFPRFIAPVEPTASNDGVSRKCGRFKLQYFPSTSTWKQSSQVTVEIAWVRVTLVRMFVNELIQFFSSTKHGMGLLMTKYSGDPATDSNGNPPPPLHYKVEILDTAVVIPRASTDFDMVALEVQRLSVCNSFHKKSFEMPTESSTLVESTAESFDITKNLEESQTDMFFDCEDWVSGSSPNSSFDRRLIRRIKVVIEGTEMFASVNPKSSVSTIVQGAKHHQFYRINGRASHLKPVFTPRGNENPTDEYRRLLWEKITRKPLSLKIFADYAPHLRLLIQDQNEVGIASSVGLKLRMSHFYLLLSVWYSNMQELPVMFPYETSDLKAWGTYAVPKHSPEYGSEEFVQWLESLDETKMEIACMFSSLSMACSFDQSGYYDRDPSCLRYLREGRRKPTDPAFTVELVDCVLHVSSDKCGVMKVGCGSSGFFLADCRRSSSLERFLSAGRRVPTKGRQMESWADLSWGLSTDGNTFLSSLPQAFQTTVFLTPGWSLTNLGVDTADAIMVDLSTIWIALDFFSGYFSHPEFGNPYFTAASSLEKLKKKLGKGATHDQEGGGLNVDFRLWLTKPVLCFPSDLHDSKTKSLRIESRTGFWYRYKSIAPYSSQEMGSTDLTLHVADEFEAPEASRSWDASSSKFVRVQTLLEGLSFGMRMDFNASTNHTDVSVRMPFFDTSANKRASFCSISSEEIEVSPVVIGPPFVCTPVEEYPRTLGASVCEVTLFLEVLPLTSEVLLRLVNGESDAVVQDDDSLFQDAELPEASFSVNTHIKSLRVFIIDPILGLHLPIAVLCVSSLKISASQMGPSESTQTVRSSEALPGDMECAVETTLWADYFKLGVTRSWEPLLEPLHCVLMFEKSRRRGQGFTGFSNTPFHVNLSGALLLTVDDAIESFWRSYEEVFAKPDVREARRSAMRRRKSATHCALPDSTWGAVVEQEIGADGHKVKIKHQVPRPLHSEERVAFSFLNLTGQRLRIHQKPGRTTEVDSKIAFITYLEHAEAKSLNFEATVSVLRNLEMVEVAFPGLPHSRRDPRRQGSMAHSVDLQVPGFKWIHGISVDTSGRSFDQLEPRSANVATKLAGDWRLANALRLLTEVGLENGGRRVTLRSLFEIRNQTTHVVTLKMHPDARHNPSLPEDLEESSSLGELHQGDSDSTAILPGAAVQIPTLLLESALRLKGNHLGCLWVRPETEGRHIDLCSTHATGEVPKPENTEVGYCTRPIQLAKVVHESALLFQGSKCEDLSPDKARSGVQVSCPVLNDQTTTPLAPFCYAVEIRRSPIVRDKVAESSARTSQRDGRHRRPQSRALSAVAEETASRRQRNRRAGLSLTHCPVAYTLMIHPPIVVQNLLPAHGRFELMHATRKTVLWFADLKPGEKVPVHSVGLDAPLLLLVNLGFCRTPVGEGALIHHGSEAKALSQPQGGLKIIGKAVSQGTKQIGKTLTSISDSPDQRGRVKILSAQSPVQQDRQQIRSSRKRQSTAETGSEHLGLDTGGIEKANASDGNVHVVDSRSYSAEEIATETVVVDGVGQKLVLRLENIRGGGGQRRISLFCPIWIVNTTEHALRYKQDKTSSFVAGTVVSPAQNGSRQIDGTMRSSVNHGRFRSLRRIPSTQPMPADNKNKETIFAGTPGALADFRMRGALTRETVAELLEKDLHPEKLAAIAFMFNFYDAIVGHQKLSIQLGDGTGKSRYTSDWSTGFSLDTVGVPQLVGMHCKDGRVLEVSVTVSVAPGILSSHTKVVRITPRYILVNQVEMPIRLWQDSSLLHPVIRDGGNPILQRGATGSKWQFARPGSSRDGSRVNQYEVLYGRTAVIQDQTVGGGLNASTTANESALYIASIGSGNLVPFHLPDTRGERQLRIDLGGSWNLTSSFNADVTGEHTLKVRKALDLRLLKHVNTRASPHYRVTLPPTDGVEWDGELGVWFETDWGRDKRIIVKGTKKGEYSFNHTDIQVGDELLRIDNVPVSQMTFAQTMRLLKERLAAATASTQSAALELSRRSRQKFGRKSRRISRDDSFIGQEFDDINPVSVVLTFRTLEERLRRLRVKAARNSRKRILARSRGLISTSNLSERGDSERESQADTFEADEFNVKVEMRAIHNSLFVIVKQQNEANPPYRIENRAMNHLVLFRQRGCNTYPWTVLRPGETKSYSWEEPMRARKLTVKVASNSVEFVGDDSIDEAFSFDGETLENERREKRDARIRRILSFHQVRSEDQAGFGVARTVKLEEIGSREELPCPHHEYASVGRKALRCQVDTDGATRVLVISDKKAAEDDQSVMEKHLTTLEKRIREENDRYTTLRGLRALLESASKRSVDRIKEAEDISSEEVDLEDPQSGGSTQDLALTQVGDNLNSVELVEAEAKLVADFPEETTIGRCHQVLIEILEATGLKSADVSGLCNPYCEIQIENRSDKKHNIFRNQKLETRKTYFVEKTLRPKWTDQTFVFNTPESAVDVSRGHAIRLTLRSFRSIGQHPRIGQTDVHLRSLRSQQELVGWYPLVGRTGRRELEETQANWGLGSVKLRVQWIYTKDALLDYFAALSETRLSDLKQSYDGLQQQLEHVVERDREREKHKDPFSVPRIPNILGMGKGEPSRLQQVVNRRSTSDQSSRLRRSRLENTKAPLKHSRERLLWSMYFQTAASKRMRRLTHADADEQGSQKRTSGLKIIAEQPDMELDSTTQSVEPLSIASPIEEKRVRLRFGSDPDSRFDTGMGLTRRRRSLSLDEATRPDDDATGGFFDLSRRMRSFQNLGVDLDYGDEAPKALIAEEIEEENNRARTVDDLNSGGLVYHRGNDRFHRNHLTYHVRLSLIDSSTNAKEIAWNQPKSLFRIASANRTLRSWHTAQAIFNDQNVTTKLCDSGISLALKLPEARTTDTLLSDVDSRSWILQKLRLPTTAPPQMKHRAVRRGEAVYTARNKFEKACKRSLRAVLNPGGWLTIRPISALNLPDSFTTMSVKLRYGSETVSTHSVDARVSPTWTEEMPLSLSAEADARTVSFQDETLASRLLSRGQSGRNIPAATGSSQRDTEFFENDLQVYVDPQKTSGSIRLSVVGERLNSKLEIGVLNIPLGAAISCCIEAIETAHERGRSDAEGAIYERWFPLMNPRDCIPSDGDLGNSTRPPETEQEQDSMFVNYFSPCIKLALMWQPSRHVGETTASFEIDERFIPSSLNIWNNLKNPDAPLTDTYFNADLSRLSVALVDSQRAQELAHVAASDVDIRYSVTKAKTRAGLVLGWLQIEHHTEGAKEPIVLAPTPVLHPQPTLQFLAVKDNHRSKGNIDSFEYIGISLQELDVTIEEPWLFDVWDFLISVVRRREMKQKAFGRSKSLYLPDLGSASESNIADGFLDHGSSGISLLDTLFDNDSSGSERKTYVEQLLLGYVKVNLSYFKGRRASWELTESGAFIRKGMESLAASTLSVGGMVLGKERAHSSIMSKWSEHTHDDDLWTDSGAKASANLPGIFAAVFPSVSEAPIRLQGKAIEHVFESSGEILDSIKNYYVNETLKQIYKIIGSLDFVGNPTMVLNSFVTGVRDFFVQPSREFLRSPNNPSRVGIGVAKGTLSLLSHSASGIFGFFAKMSATAGQAAASLSFDADYQQWHRDMILTEAKNLSRQWKKRGAGKISKILTRPLVDILRGIALGTTGLVLSPYKGAKREGGAGFAKGIAIGTIGVFVKPTVGVLDAFTHFTGSIHDVAKSVNVLDKRLQPVTKLRLPYSFGFMNVLVPYDSVTGRSVQLLKDFPISKRRRVRRTPWNEVHVASESLNMEPGTETILIVSTHRIVLFKVKRDNGNQVSALCWEVHLGTEIRITSRIQEHGHNGVALTISTRMPSSSVAFDIPSENDAVERHDTGQFEALSEVPSYASDGQDAAAQTVSYGTQPSGVWEFSAARGEVNRFTVRDNHFFGATKKQGGDVLEWFTVLAEFHHRRQLTRLHNAICCLAGDLESVSIDHGLNRDGSLEGYTSFGQFLFSREEADFVDGHENSISEELEDIPWVDEKFLVDTAGMSREEIAAEFTKQRKRWTWEKEMGSSRTMGGPSWLVDARAKTLFLPEGPPVISDLQFGESADCNTILRQLKQGSISFSDASSRISEGIIRLRESIKAAPSPFVFARTTQNKQDTGSPRYGRKRTGDLTASLSDSGLEQFFSLGSSVVDEGSSEDAEAQVAEASFRRSPLRREEGIVSPSRGGSGLRKTIEEARKARFGKASPVLDKITEDINANGAADAEATSEEEGEDASFVSHEQQDMPSAAGVSLGSKDESSRGAPSDSHAISDDPKPTLVSRDSETSGDKQSTETREPDTKLDRMETMLEKLLELSLPKEEAGQASTTAIDAVPNTTSVVASSRSPTVGGGQSDLAKEIANLRAQMEAGREEMEAQRRQDSATIASLQLELSKLKEKVDGDGDGSVRQRPSPKQRTFGRRGGRTDDEDGDGDGDGDGSVHQRPSPKQRTFRRRGGRTDDEDGDGSIRQGRFSRQRTFRRFVASRDDEDDMKPEAKAKSKRFRFKRQLQRVLSKKPGAESSFEETDLLSTPLPKGGESDEDGEASADSSVAHHELDLPDAPLGLDLAETDEISHPK